MIQLTPEEAALIYNYATSAETQALVADGIRNSDAGDMELAAKTIVAISKLKSQMEPTP